MNYYITFYDLSKYNKGKEAKIWIGKKPLLSGNFPVLNESQVIKALFNPTYDDYKWKIIK